MLINAIFLDLIGGYGNLGSHPKKKIEKKNSGCGEGKEK